MSKLSYRPNRAGPGRVSLAYPDRARHNTADKIDHALKFERPRRDRERVTEPISGWRNETRFLAWLRHFPVDPPSAWEHDDDKVNQKAFSEPSRPRDVDCEHRLGHGPGNGNRLRRPMGRSAAIAFRRHGTSRGLDAGNAH